MTEPDLRKFSGRIGVRARYHRQPHLEEQRRQAASRGADVAILSNDVARIVKAEVVRVADR